jgi:hypothetical protein
VRQKSGANGVPLLYRTPSVSVKGLSAHRALVLCNQSFYQ